MSVCSWCCLPPVAGPGLVAQYAARPGCQHQHQHPPPIATRPAKLQTEEEAVSLCTV